MDPGTLPLSYSWPSPGFKQQYLLEIMKILTAHGIGIRQNSQECCLRSLQLSPRTASSWARRWPLTFQHAPLSLLPSLRPSGRKDGPSVPHSSVVIQCFVKCHSCSLWTLCPTRGGLEPTLLSAPGDLAQETLFLAASLSLPAAALTFFLGLVLLLSCFFVVPGVEPRALRMLR